MVSLYTRRETISGSFLSLPTVCIAQEAFLLCYKSMATIPMQFHIQIRSRNSFISRQSQQEQGDLKWREGSGIDIKPSHLEGIRAPKVIF